MNSYVRIFLDDYGRYFKFKTNCEKMEILGHFLTSDVGCYCPNFKNWAEENKYMGYGGNLSELDKEGDYILLRLDEYIDPDRVAFKMPKQAFIDVLDAWGKVCKLKLPQILIAYDGQRFTVEGQNTPVQAEEPILGDEAKE